MKPLTIHAHLLPTLRADSDFADGIRAVLLALAPYAVAALLVFAYHEQWLK